MIAPEQIELVQRSFSRISKMRDQAAHYFYTDLFATAPEVEPYFAKADMSKQGMKLLSTLAIVVAGLNNLETILTTVRKLAERHVDYGVTVADYDKVGASLIRMLQASLGAQFTPEVRTAWEQAYAMLAKVMIEAAYPPDPAADESAEPAPAA